MGFDLLTGVFRNWTLVFFGNFAGALTVAVSSCTSTGADQTSRPNS